MGADEETPFWPKESFRRTLRSVLSALTGFNTARSGRQQGTDNNRAQFCAAGCGAVLLSSPLTAILVHCEILSSQRRLGPSSIHDLKA